LQHCDCEEDDELYKFRSDSPRLLSDGPLKSKTKILKRKNKEEFKEEKI